MDRNEKEKGYTEIYGLIFTLRVRVHPWDQTLEQQSGFIKLRQNLCGSASKQINVKNNSEYELEDSGNNKTGRLQRVSHS